MKTKFKKSVLILFVAFSTFLSSYSKSASVVAVPVTAALGADSLIAATADSAFTSVASNIFFQSKVATAQGAEVIGNHIIGIVTAPITETYKIYDINTNFGGPTTLVNGLNQLFISMGCDANLPQTGFASNGTITFTVLSAAKMEGIFQFNAVSLPSYADIKIVTAGSFSKNS